MVQNTWMKQEGRTCILMEQEHMPRHQQEIFAKEALRLPAGWNSSILWPVNQQYIPYGRSLKSSFCLRRRCLEKWDLQLLIVTTPLSPSLVPGKFPTNQ